jgi:hypothetical protein
MNEHPEVTISAALDGERVDLGELREALAVPEGRDVLAGFLLIRAAAAAAFAEPGDTLKVNLQKVARRPWFMAGPRVPARLAASLAAVVAGGALWFGLSVHGVPAQGPVAHQSQAAPTYAPATDHGPVVRPAAPFAGEQARPVAKPARLLQFEGWREGS